MNNKIKMTIALLVVAGSTFAQKATVNANITGLEDGELVFHYRSGEKYKADTVQTKNGQFTWEAELREPQKVAVWFPNFRATFFAENRNINITGTADSLHKLNVTGSSLQDEAYAYERSIKDLTDQEAPIYRQWGKVSLEEQRKNEEKLAEIREAKAERATQYIAAYPQSYFSLDMVDDRAGMGSYEKVKPLYDLLDPAMQQADKGKALAERLSILKRSSIGETVLDFTQNDTDGNPVHFADFKGKYVLIDFWASWCGPCRAENPNLLKDYNKFKDQNFTIVGVSLDNDGDRWKKAIQDDGMPWTQLSDLKGWENEVSTYYGIRAIPSSLLVDPAGKIIAKDLRGAMLSRKLEELFN
ncbi:AhpC/TSA family protein [Sphingobacterium phlebotomi]|uniref:AhpC/TSA family protein n=1 Tax=Sphingobacterium phlebotomi TaxID=2605433 RepID=A0A5D4H021_9SPHI|nr:TlpA disulfide reductase family protein [Sphingobacterium phlebotomi]TYR33623.1 AhpC/TSA family protein [Sphingobacterium phlebotomi]